MAILTECSECSAEMTASVRNSNPLCDNCKRKYGWKPWEEMTLEEKVEDLHKRLQGQEHRNARIG